MRILNTESDKKLDNVMLFLTKNELQQLVGYARQLLERPSTDHHHLTSEDYQKEVTLAIYDAEDAEKFSPRVQKLICEDQ